MRCRPAIGIDNNFTAGQTGIAIWPPISNLPVGLIRKSSAPTIHPCGKISATSGVTIARISSVETPGLCWVESTSLSTPSMVPSLLYRKVTWLLASGPNSVFASALRCAASSFKNLMREMNKGRHQLFCFAAGIAKHQALISGALIFIA